MKKYDYIFNKAILNSIFSSYENWVFFIKSLNHVSNINNNDIIYKLYEDNTYLILNYPIVYNKIEDYLIVDNKVYENFRISLINKNYNSNIKILYDINFNYYQIYAFDEQYLYIFLNFDYMNDLITYNNYKFSKGYFFTLDINTLKEVNDVTRCFSFDFFSYLKRKSINICTHHSDYIKAFSQQNSRNTIDQIMKRFKINYEKNFDYGRFYQTEDDYVDVDYVFSVCDFFMNGNFNKYIQFLKDQGEILKSNDLYYLHRLPLPYVKHRNFYYISSNCFVNKENIIYDNKEISLSRGRILFYKFNSSDFINLPFQFQHYNMIEDYYIDMKTFIENNPNYNIPNFYLEAGNIFDDLNMYISKHKFLDVLEILNSIDIYNYNSSIKIKNKYNGINSLRFVDNSNSSFILLYNNAIDIISNNFNDLSTKVFDSDIVIENVNDKYNLFILEEYNNILYNNDDQNIIPNDGTTTLIQRFPVVFGKYNNIQLEYNKFLPIKDAYDDNHNFRLGKYYINQDETNCYYNFEILVEKVDMKDIDRKINFLFYDNQILEIITKIKLEEGLLFNLISDENIDDLTLLKIIYLLNEENTPDFINTQLNDDKLKLLFKKYTDKEILFEFDNFITLKEGIDALVSKNFIKI